MTASSGRQAQRENDPMLLQTNSYIVPKDKRAEHARLMRRFRQVLGKLGCDMFEVYEQVGANWGGGDTNGRYVQIMRFRDRKHQLAVQNAERGDPVAQACIAEFCQLVNFQYQQQQGFFAVGFYNSVLPVAPSRAQPQAEAEVEEGAVAEAGGEIAAMEAEAHTPLVTDPLAAEATRVEEAAADDLAYPDSPTDAPAHDADQVEARVVDHDAAPAPEFVGEVQAPLALPDHRAETPDEVAASGPPLDLTESTVDAHLSEDELLGEVTGAASESVPHLAIPQDNGQEVHDADLLETGEVDALDDTHIAEAIPAASDHESSGETPDEAPVEPPDETVHHEAPAESVEEAPRRSLFRRTRRSG